MSIKEVSLADKQTCGCLSPVLLVKQKELQEKAESQLTTILYR